MTLQFSLSHLILFVAGLLCTTTSSSSSSVTLSSSSARLSLTGTWRSFPGVDFSCDPPPPPGGTEWVQRCGCWPCGGGAGGGVRNVRRGCGWGADRAAGVRRGCRPRGGGGAARAAGVRGGGVRTVRRGGGADFLAAALRGARGFARSSAAARVPCGNGVGRTPLVSCRNPCTSGSGRARCTWPFRRSFALSGVMPQV